MRLKQVILWLTVLAFTCQLQAQGDNATLSPEVKSNTVAEIARLLDENYVFPDKAKQAGQFLYEQLEVGKLTGDSVPAFANVLTQALQESTNDKHLRVGPIPVPGSVPSKEQALDYWHRSAEQRRTNNQGFIEVKVLPGNIGYLDFRFFAPPELAQNRADAAMQLLENTDAVVIDMRQNGGGNPAMVQYICSYFFDEKILLNSLYWRAGDRTDEFWVLDEVKGKKRPNVPLFVLTSNRTFSGAEEFSYNLQSRKRATIVGETTGGGAHPGGGFRINDYYQMFISTGRAINPVTNTNWEGTGVVPDVAVPADHALDKALELAKQAASEVQNQFKDRYRTAMSATWDELEKASSLLEQGRHDEAKAITSQTVKRAIAADVMTLDSILALGIEYRQRLGKPQVALSLFNAGIEISEQPSRFHNAFGETAMELTRYDEAVEHFKLAIATAEEAGAPQRQIEFLQNNLTEAQAKLARI